MIKTFRVSDTHRASQIITKSPTSAYGQLSFEQRKAYSNFGSKKLFPEVYWGYQEINSALSRNQWQ